MKAGRNNFSSLVVCGSSSWYSLQECIRGEVANVPMLLGKQVPEKEGECQGKSGFEILAWH